jgi:hypothetical protein
VSLQSYPLNSKKLHCRLLDKGSISMKKFFWIFLAILIFAIAVLSFFAGLFDGIKITNQTVGPYYLVYRTHKGSYSGIQFVMGDVYRYMREKKSMTSENGFVIYYDNPEKIRTDSLRSIAGVITDSSVNVEDPYKSGIFQKTEALVGTFPIRSFMSYSIGVYKFYPALEKKLAQDKYQLSGPVMEIFDLEKRQITYVAPVNQKVSPAPLFTK